jgi:lipoprotein-anchoring transpeptidase ErfK/SrfK
MVLERVYDDRGRPWVSVRLPVLPNGSTGWVPEDALGPYHRVRTWLKIDRARRKATLVKSGKVIFRARVGVGRKQWPTPGGEFYVRDRLSGFGSGGIYGPLAFGLSARSAVLTDWPGGGFVGVHGTNEPNLIPGRISHGCVRMKNRDILRLGKLMRVGTPVTIT